MSLVAIFGSGMVPLVCVRAPGTHPERETRATCGSGTNGRLGRLRADYTPGRQFGKTGKSCRLDVTGSGRSAFLRQNGSPAARSTAVTGIAALCGGCVALVEHVGVVIRQLLAGRDRAHRLDPDAPIVYHGIAIRLARVIDVARIVAADGGVDDDIIVDGEQEGVVPLERRVGIARVRRRGRQPLTRVLDEARSGGDSRGGKGAESLDGRRANLEWRSRRAGSAPGPFSRGTAIRRRRRRPTAGPRPRPAERATWPAPPAWDSDARHSAAGGPHGCGGRAGRRWAPDRAWRCCT